MIAQKRSTKMRREAPSTSGYTGCLDQHPIRRHAQHGRPHLFGLGFRYGSGRTRASIRSPDMMFRCDVSVTRPSSMKLVSEPFRRQKIGALKPLGETLVYRGKDSIGLAKHALIS